MSHIMKVLLIDHYDSFTYNLAHQFWMKNVPLDVYAHDQISIDFIQEQNYSHYVLSPGPGHPKNDRDFYLSSLLLKTIPFAQPILGVCLGHQGIAQHFGANIVKAPTVVHGKTSQISHIKQGVFTQLPSPFQAMRYHSLCIDPKTLPQCLTPTAWSEDGIIMGFEHKKYPIFGVQFHPESVGTPCGALLIDQFLRY